MAKKQENLKYFVLNPETDTFYKTGEQLTATVEQIVKRLCTVPVAIEYKNCLHPDASETSLVAIDFIYQDTYQWLEIHPHSLNLSEKLYLTFESLYGSAKFCLGRTIQTDPNGLPDCYETNPNAPVIRVGPKNPCHSYSVNCPPIYIGVRGKSGGAANAKCDERACDSLNQIKISVMHEGLYIF